MIDPEQHEDYPKVSMATFAIVFVWFFGAVVHIYFGHSILAIVFVGFGIWFYLNERRVQSTWKYAYWVGAHELHRELDK